MSALIFLVFASTLGIMDAKTEILGYEAIYWCMAIMALAYIRYAFKNRKNVKKLLNNNTIKWLLVFEICGAIMVTISFLGLNTLLVGSELLVDKSYIPRQAIYLFFMPAVVVMSEPEYRHFFKIVLSKNILLFFVIYIYNVIISGSHSLNINPIFLLIILHLYKQPDNEILNWFMFVLLMLTPISIGGELTNVLLRILYLLFFVFQKRKKAVTGLIAFGVALCIISVFIVPFGSDYITPHLDANSAWRLNFWNDELIQLVRSKGIGVGFGTSFATVDFVANQPSILKSPYDPIYRQQTVEYLIITTAAHNSFISLAFRMGIVGIITFIGFLSSIFINIWKDIENTPIYAIFAFFASILIISVNVGLESVEYLIYFITALGIFCKNYNIKKHILR